MPKRISKGDRMRALVSSAPNSEEDEVSSTAGSIASNDSRLRGGSKKGPGGRRRAKDREASSDSLESLEVGPEDFNNKCDEDCEDHEDSLSWEDELKMVVSDGLTEKRTSTREASLAKVAKLLTQHVAESVLETHRLSLQDAVKRSLKREAKESALASRTLSVMFASLGRGNYELLKEIVPLLRATILSGSSPAARAEAIRALGIGSFVNCTLPEEINEVLSMLQGILESKDSSAEVHVAALAMHGLLYTTLPESSDLRREIFDRTMDSHISLMGSKDPNTRIIAGENVAIMYELLEENGTRIHCDHYDELLDQMSELANESGKQKSRKEKSTQKAAFRSIISSVDRGERPNTKLQFQSQTIRINGFSQLRPLEIFKDLLGEGLHIHFVENPLFHDMFGVDLSGLNAGKTFYSGADGRARTRDLKAGRAGKAREIDLLSDY